MVCGLPADWRNCRGPRGRPRDPLGRVCLGRPGVDAGRIPPPRDALGGVCLGRPGLTVASIARRPNGKYRPRYRDLAGKEHARHFDLKVDAQLWLDSVTTAVHTGSYVDPRRMRLTVGEWAPQWLATRVDLKPTTRRGYEVALRSRILPEWGPVRFGDVTYHGIAEWVARLTGSGLSGATVQHHHRVFSLLLAAAVRDGRLARNPATGVPLPRRARGE